MSNPFDDKIKESLENFEMPYDAGAWAQLAEQLPPAGGAPSGGSQFGWKAVAVLALAVTTITTAWYLNDKTEVADVKSVQIEVTVKTDDNKKESAKEVALDNSIESIETVSKTEISVESITESKNPALEQANSNLNKQKAEQTPTKPELVESKKSTPQAVNEKPNQPVKADKASQIEEKQLVAKFLPSALAICVGQDISFINESSDKKANMIWSFGDGTSKSESDPVHSFVQPGKYTVSLTADNGSKTSDYSVNITVNPTPRPILSAQRKLDGYVAIPLYRFTTAVQPSESAVWSFSDGTRIVGNSAEHLFRSKGTSTAKITVTNGYGCSQSMDEKYDIYKDFDLLAPNTFSPNADGINETFMPKALPEMGVAFEMTITNPRTGETVYRTSNADEPWNGKLNNVNPKLESGVYIWTVILKENVAENKVFNGKINLNR